MNKNAWKVVALSSLLINFLILGVGYYYILRPLNRLRNLEANTEQLCSVYDSQSSTLSALASNFGLGGQITEVCE